MDMIDYIKPFIKFKVPYITNIEDGVDEEYEALVIEKYGLKFYIINLYTLQRKIVKNLNELREHGWITDIFRLCTILDTYYEEVERETELYVTLFKTFPQYKGKFVFSAVYGNRDLKNFLLKFESICEIEKIRDKVYWSSIECITNQHSEIIELVLKRHDVTFRVSGIKGFLGFKPNKLNQIKEHHLYQNFIVRLFRIMDDIHFEKGEIKELKTFVHIVQQQMNIKSFNAFQRRSFYDFVMRLQKHASKSLRYELNNGIKSKSKLEINETIEQEVDVKANSVNEKLVSRDVSDLIENTFLHKQGGILKQDDNVVKSSRKVINRDIQIDNLTSLGVNKPSRVEHTVLSTQRSQSLSQNLKSLYNNQCQVCGERIQIGINEYASESHHIQPVGGKHQGPDIADNIIILCPNHHFMFDRGAITIDLVHKKVKHIDSSNALNNTPLILKHDIDECYVTYHNKHLLREIKVNGQPSGSNRKASNFKTRITLEDSDGEFHEFILPDIQNNHLLKGIEKDLVYVRKGEQINFKGFDYAVKEIKKI